MADLACHRMTNLSGGISVMKHKIDYKLALWMPGIALREHNLKRKICNFFRRFTLYIKSGQIQGVLQ